MRSRWTFLLVLALSAGCATPVTITEKLWSSDLMRRFNEPAEHPNLQLFRAPPPSEEVLVVYDEAQGESGHVRRRAYWLERNLDRVAAGRKPQFVQATQSRGMLSVPLGDEPVQNVPNPLLAAGQPNKSQYILYRSGHKDGPYQLPTYKRGYLEEMCKVSLTPFTVAADAAWMSALVVSAGFIWMPYAYQSPH